MAATVPVKKKGGVAALGGHRPASAKVMPRRFVLQPPMSRSLMPSLAEAERPDQARGGRSGRRICGSGEVKWAYLPGSGEVADVPSHNRFIWVRRTTS